jgi:hypothetical protein
MLILLEIVVNNVYLLLRYNHSATLSPFPLILLGAAMTPSFCENNLLSYMYILSTVRGVIDIFAMAVFRT